MNSKQSFSGFSSSSPGLRVLAGISVKPLTSSLFACLFFDLVCGRELWSELFTDFVLCCTMLNYSIVSDSLWPHDCSPSGSSVPGILQARILEWVAMPSSRGSSQPRDRTQVSHIAGRFYIVWAIREAHEYWSGWPVPSPGDLRNPATEPESPALQADSLPAELPGKPDALMRRSSLFIFPF